MIALHRLPGRMTLRTCAFAAFLLVAPGRAVLAQPVAAGTVLDEIVAVVGEEPVLASEVNAVAASAVQQGQPLTDALWSRALDELVNQKVLVARAQRDTTLSVTDDQIDQQLDQRTRTLAQQLGGEAQLEAYYGKTVDEIKTLFREDIRQQLLAQQYQGRRLRDVTVTPSEVRAWFATIPDEEIPEVPELVRVAHIVKVPQPDPAARTAARAFAEALRDSILAEQATIEDLARRHTADRGSAATGGRYDGFNVRDLVPEFGLVASNLEAGALSQVFETQFGYHVMRLNQRQGDVVSFNHILIQVEATNLDPSTAIAELTAIRDSIVTLGLPFELAAKRNSEDSFTASQGGYLSDPRTGERELRLEALGDFWQATIDTMTVNEISQPAEVELLDGSRAWHIVLLQRRTPAHTLSLETDYALLSQYALQEKRNDVLDAWLADIRSTVYVEIKTDRYQPSGGV